MLLTVKERLVLLSVLPSQGNILTVKIVRQLRERLSLTEAEHKAFEIKEDKATGRVTWNKKALEPVEIPIGEKAMDIIVDAFKRADTQQKISIEMIDVYDRFINSNKEPS